MSEQPNITATDEATNGQPPSSSASATESKHPGGPQNQPLHSEDVHPRDSAASPTRSAPSGGNWARKIRYEAYLQTAHWRAVRNRALKLAGYRCAECGVKRDLQVHHLSYERLGAELDSDLRVICRGCHLGLHVHEIEESIGLYIKLVSEALAAESFSSLSELLEAVKCRCARLRIPYAGAKIHAAIDRVKADKRLTFSAPVPQKYAELLERSRDGQPLTQAEACECLAKYGLGKLVKHMPPARPMPVRRAEHLKAYHLIIQAISEQEDRCRELEAQKP